jgi:hypothetical protein
LVLAAVAWHVARGGGQAAVLLLVGSSGLWIRLRKGARKWLDWTGLDWLVAERHRVKAEFANVFVLQVQRVTGLISKYILRPKIFAHLDFYILHLTIRLIKKICENVKTIMIYLKYI